MIQDKIFFDEKDPTGLSYNTPFTFYGSYQGRLYSKTPTGSIKYYTQNSDLSAYATTGSNQFSGSQTITGSLTVTGTITGTVAGTTATASYVEYTNVANKPALVSGSSQVTYSGLTGVPSGIVSGSAQIASFGIFATTGSNGFNGSQSITGSLTVTGQVVAQTLNVQQVTSSIVYSSGSNIFGNSLANTQQFTGSVSVTGSLAIAGTTTASDVVTISKNQTGNTNTLVISNPSTTGAFAASGMALQSYNGTSTVDVLTISATSNTWNYQAYGANSGIIYAGGTGGLKLFAGNASGTIKFYTAGDGTGNERLSIASTGAATFSSSVRAAQVSIGTAISAWGAGYDAAFQIGPSGGMFAYSNSIQFGSNYYFNGSNYIAIQTGSAGKLSFDGNVFNIEIAPSVTAGSALTFSNPFSIASTGAATFSNSVTIQGGNSLFVNNAANTRSGYLKTSAEGTELSSFAGAGEPLILIAPDTTATMRFYTGGSTSASEKMRITSGGDVQIGLSANYSPITLYIGTATNGSTGQGGQSLFGGAEASQDTGHASGTASGSNYHRFIYNGSVIGSITQSGVSAVLYNTSSDYRLKEDLQEIKGLEKIQAIKVYNYKWKAEESRMDGVLAHELAEILPYAVHGKKDEVDEEGNDKMQGVDYSKIVPILIKAMQELSAKIETLEAEIQTLKQ